MEEASNTLTGNLFLYVIGPIVAIMAPAVVGYVKYKLSRKEKEHEEKMEAEKAERQAEIDERNKRRDKIEADVEELKKDVAKTASIILSCKHPDCPSKELLAEHFKQKYTRP